MSPDINREGTHVTIAHIRKVVTSNPRKLLRKCEGNPQTSNVKLSKSFPHKHLNKSLHSSYQLTGKALVHGTPSRVTNAAIVKGQCTFYNSTALSPKEQVHSAIINEHFKPLFISSCLPYARILVCSTFLPFCFSSHH